MTEIRNPHIVALSGSPRRNGNTVTLMRWVLEGCREAGATVEWLHVVDYEIRYCQGCFTCLRAGECPLPDDFLMVRDRLVAADGIVAGSPVYEGQPTAQLKTLLDRLTLLHLWTDTFERQRSVGVATSGIAPTGGVARQLAEFFGKSSGTIGARTSDLKKGYQFLGDVHDRRLPGRARNLGQTLVKDIQRAEQRHLPTPKVLWIQMLRRLLVRPMMDRNPDQFAGAIQVLQAKGSA